MPRENAEELSMQSVTIVGAGLMGHALAAVHAIGGMSVQLFDNDPAQLKKSEILLSKIFNSLKEGGVLTDQDRDQAQERIAFAVDLPSALESADLILEVVPEKPGIKRQVYEEIDRFARLDAVIASNTSYLNIFPFVAPRRQKTCLIAHWYTPPYIIDLVDIVPGPETDSKIIHAMASLYKKMGKQPIVFSKFIPGYIANRLQSALNLEAFHLLEEGFSPEDIDSSIQHGLALRLCLLGQLKKADFTGLEMVRNGLASRAYSPPEATGKSIILDKLIEQGRKGIFSGKGFYDYNNTPVETLLEERDAELIALKLALFKIKKWDNK
jgi:3-hydroxybutyryl-CoA dehydrogenase